MLLVRLIPFSHFLSSKYFTFTIVVYDAIPFEVMDAVAEFDS